MNVRIAGRGHSFKGAGLYYLHDKDASTKERIGFTYTHNLITNDPDKAIGWMIYTAKRAEYLKQQAGIKKTGAKRRGGPVYTYSINYEDTLDKPSKDQMIQDAIDTFEKFGFSDHQATFTEHTDTKHPHVHVMVNMISPTDGRIHVPSWSKLKSSDWALQKELEQGLITSPQRVENSARRKRGEFVKYKEKPHHRKVLIQKLYERSDNGKAFQAALEDRGFTLCRGDRRGWVLVDDAGKIHSLSRQLDKEQRKTYQDKLKSLQDVPLAREASHERKQQNVEPTKTAQLQPEFNTASNDNVHEEQKPEPIYDREQDEIDRQNAMLDAADEAARKQLQAVQKRKTGQKTTKIPEQNNNPVHDNTHLVRLDAMMAWNKIESRKRAEFEEMITEFYNRDETVERKAALEKQLKKHDTRWSRLTGKYQAIEEDLRVQILNLENIDMRIEEQRSQLDSSLKREKEEYLSGRNDPEKILKRQMRREAYKAKIRERLREKFNQSREHSQDKDRGYGFDR